MTCILCLGVSDLLRYLETDPGTVKALLAEVLPEVSVEVADDFTTVCETCTGKLEELREFKRQCLAVEQRVRQQGRHRPPAAGGPGGGAPSLADVHFQQGLGRVPAGSAVCRACFRPWPVAASNSLAGDTTHAVYLASLFRKLDLSLTAGPTLCLACSGRAEDLYQFQQKCLLVQETLKDQAFQDQLLLSGGHHDLAPLTAPAPRGHKEREDREVDREEEEDRLETLTATRALEGELLGCGAAAAAAALLLGDVDDDDDCDIEEYLNLMAAEAEAAAGALGAEGGDQLDLGDVLDGEEGDFGPAGGRLSPTTLDRLCPDAASLNGKASDLDACLDGEEDGVEEEEEEEEDDGAAYPRSDGEDVPGEGAPASASVQAGALRCPTCSFTAGTRRGLRRHRRLQHPGEAPQAAAPPTKHACLYCEFTARAQPALEVHVKMEHDRVWTVHRCESCDFATKWRSVLETHNVLKHDLERRLYRCPYCKFRTADRQDYRRHHNVRHNDGVRTYDCLYCEYKTRFKYHLKTHVRSKHDVSTSNLFRCSVCGYRTKWRSSLLMHGKFKHAGENEVYECVRCDFKTKKLSRLKIHRKLEHEITDPLAYIEFRAELKNRQRARQLELQRQRGGHTAALALAPTDGDRGGGERKEDEEEEGGLGAGPRRRAALHRCKHCGYTARRRDTLQRHVNARHDNERGEFYTCSECGYRSKRKDALKRHVDVKHPKYAEQ